MTRPVVTALSHATRPIGSSRRMASRTASLIWSHILSGWPSVTDSLVRCSLAALMNVVVIGESVLPLWPPLNAAAIPLPTCRFPLPTPSRARLPRRQVPLLLCRQRVDRHAHRRELQACDLRVDLLRHRVHADVEFLLLQHEVLGGQRLVGEAHVHDARRVALGRGEIDQPSLAEQEQLAAVAQTELLDERTHLPPAFGH